jgi:HAD superfamily hydrolase (TIGR01509 family)
VIFDMDGVLVDSEPFIGRAAVAMFTEKGFAVDPGEFLQFTGMGEDRFLGGVAELHKVVLDLSRDKKRTYEIYLDLIRGRLGPMPGVHDFIARCQAKGLRLAVASSADAMKVEGNLREIGVPIETFGAVLVGEDVARKKPWPDVFLEASRRLGLDAADCLVIEDAVSGVTAARAAGSRCLGLTSSFSAGALIEAGADWTATTLADAPRAVLDW